MIYYSCEEERPLFLILNNFQSSDLAFQPNCSRGLPGSWSRIITQLVGWNPSHPKISKEKEVLC